MVTKEREPRSYSPGQKLDSSGHQLRVQEQLGSGVDKNPDFQHPLSRISSLK